MASTAVGSQLRPVLLTSTLAAAVVAPATPEGEPLPTELMAPKLRHDTGYYRVRLLVGIDTCIATNPTFRIRSYNVLATTGEFTTADRALFVQDASVDKPRAHI